MSKGPHTHCTFAGCGRKHWSRGHCQTHYAQARRGVPLTPIQARGSARDRCRTLHARKTEPRAGWAHTNETCRLCDEVVWAKGLCDGHYQIDTKWRRHGLTAEGYEKMLKDQDGKCFLCSASAGPLIEGRSLKYRLSVDHCHQTGEIRGLLCDRCNRGIGLLQDDPNLIRRAAEYLDKHRSKAAM